MVRGVTVTTPNVGPYRSSSIPFGIPSSSSMRYQQVYSDPQFAEIGPDGVFITRIAFDLAVGPGARQFSATISNIQINFSTTTRSSGDLSTVFAENVGADDVVVVGPGPLRLSSAGYPGRFDISIPLTTSFFYDPAAGNLLLDVRNIYSGSSFENHVSDLSGIDLTFDGSSRVSSGTVQSLSGFTDTFGLRTRFEVTPVPKLTISLQSSNLVFSWSDQQDDFTLQQSVIIGSGATWQPTDGTVTTNGPYKEVTLPLDPSASARFFRLMLPTTSAGSAGIQAGAKTFIPTNKH